MIRPKLLVPLVLACNFGIDAAISEEGWDNRFHIFPGPPLVHLSGNPLAPGPVAPYGNGEFLIGGRFTNLAGVGVLNLARWNGSGWTNALETQGSSGEIGITFNGAQDYTNGLHTIATYNEGPGSPIELLVGGQGLTNAGGVSIGNIGWWTGTQWINLGGGTTGLVSTVLFGESGEKYAGGNFTSIGGVAAANIAVFKNGSWTPLGNGLPFVPETLIIHAGELYAGGRPSTTADGTYGLLRWTGTEWKDAGGAFPAGETGTPLAFLSSLEGLYLGGAFTNIGTVAATNIALWNGTEWKEIGSGLPGRVASLAIHNGNLLAAGRFLLPPFQQTGLARWDGTNWILLSDAPVLHSRSMAVSGERIFTRGKVNTQIYEALNGAAYFNGNVWKPLGQGFQRDALQLDGERRIVHLAADEKGILFAGTWPSNARGKLRRWNGDFWEPIAPGLPFPSRINAIGVQRDSYWIGTTTLGWATPAGTRIAATDGTNWTDATQMFPVNSIVVAGAKVYAGGDTSLHEWNGVEFSPISSHTNRIASMTTDGNNLYVAGRPKTGDARYSISRFDGQEWTELANSITNSGSRIEIQMIEGSLYVFGDFAVISGKAIKSVARWNGSDWQAVLPDGFPGLALSLAGDGRGTLYVGGLAYTASIIKTNLYQVRNGQVTGVNSPGPIEAAHWWRGSLYVAGLFSSIAGTESQSFGSWHDPEAAVEVMVLAPTNAFSGTIAEVGLSVVNVRETNLNDVLLIMPLAPGATPVELPSNVSVEGTNAVWQISTLAPGVTNLSLKVNLQGAAGTNFTFQVLAEGQEIPTFRSSPTWTTIAQAPTPELRIEIVGQNSDGSWRVGWSGTTITNWVVEKSGDLAQWTPQSIEWREGQSDREFTIPKSEDGQLFWRLRMAPAAILP